MTPTPISFSSGINRFRDQKDNVEIFNYANSFAKHKIKSQILALLHSFAECTLLHFLYLFIIHSA